MRDKEQIEHIIQREGIQLANNAQRLLAFILDELLLSLVIIIALWGDIQSSSKIEDKVYIINSYILHIVCLRFVYQAIFVHMFGATIGKLALKISVIEISTIDNPSFMSSIKRSLVRTTGELFLYFSFLFAFVDSFKQSLHDIIGQTLVIKNA